MLPTLGERFTSKVSFGQCWHWRASLFRNGYGQFRHATGRLAHRYAWEVFNGPILDGLNIDHLCRVRNCVNPNHMELVTRGENVLRGVGPTAINARKTHCSLGHALEGANLQPSKLPARSCRTCNNDQARQRREAARG